MNKQKLRWNNHLHHAMASKALLENNILLTTTDTVVGLLGPLTAEAHISMNTIKQRPATTPLIVLVASYEKAKNFIASHTITSSLNNLMQHCWPGPVTIVCKAKKEMVPRCSVTQEQTIALRSPNHSGLQALLQNYEGLFSTSANMHQEPIPATLDEVDSRIRAACAYEVDEPQENTFTKKESSSMIDISNVYCTLPDHTLHNPHHTCIEKGFVRVLRNGAYPISQLEDYYGAPFIKF